MIQKKDFSFALIPAALLWFPNIFHILFTIWAIGVGGSGMEMAVLFPLCFIQIPGVILLFATVICAFIARADKAIFLKALAPVAAFILQVAVFWLCAFYR